MKNRLLDFVKEYKFVLLLLLLNAVIIVTNFVPGYWLSGWDNLHPEFNFQINLNRVFFSAWEEFQGLGLPSGMAHASDLPRLLIMWALSLFFSTSSLRFIWQFLMLLIGSVGFYFFAKEFVFFKSEKKHVDLFAFLGAVFYVLNLGTLQNFYAPQSMFTTQFGFLPLLFLFGFGFLFNSRKNSLFWYGVVGFLASTQAYTPTLILAYFLFLGVGIAYYVFVSKFSKVSIKRSFLLLLVTFASNAYWLAPFVYYLFTIAGTVQNASINRFSSDESFLLNKEFGSFENISILRGFWFGNTDYDIAREGFYPMFEPWDVHLALPYIPFIGGFLFVFLLLGGISALFDRRIKNRYLFIVFFLLSIFFLRNNNPPLGFLFTFLQDHLPLFKEALRFPFTKFSILTVFSYSILFSLGISFFSKILKEIKMSVYGVGSVLLLLLIVWMFPMFKGNLFSKNLIVSYPDSYFEVFDFFEEQDKKSRILNLPMASYWAWPYYDWGYRGSGFLWYGLNQPILDRAFDVWHPKNEEAYWQISQSIYSNDIENIKSALDKFDIRWLLLDESILVPGNPNAIEVLNLIKLKNILDEDTSFKNSMGSGKLSVYEYLEADSFVEGYSLDIPIFSTSEPFLNIRKSDGLYESFGDYVIDNSDSVGIFEDFQKRDFSGNISKSYDSITIERSIELEEGNKSLIVPSAFQFMDSLPVSVEILSNTELKVSTIPLELYVDGESIYSNSQDLNLTLPFTSVGDVISLGEDLTFEVIQIPSTLGEGYLNVKEASNLKVYRRTNRGLDLSNLLGSSTLSSCSVASEGSYSAIKTSDSLTLETVNNTACVSRRIDPNLLQNVELLGIEFDYSEKQTYPKYCLYDAASGKCLNSTLKYINFPAKGSIKDLVNIEEGSPNLIWHFYAEAGAEVKSSISYENASINFFDLVENKKVSFEDFDVNGISLSLESDGGSLISVKVPIVQQSSLVESDDFSRRQFSYNDACFYEKIVTPEVENNALVLRNQEGESCLYLNFPDLPHKYDYVVEFSHRKDSGKNQEMCIVDSVSSRCVMPYKLTDDSDWTLHNIIVNRGDPTRHGYALIIHNVTLANQPAVNYYDSLEIYPIPLTWLENIRLGDSIVLGNIAEGNPLTFESNLFSYKVTNEASDFVKLSQTFDPGWLALCDNGLCDRHFIFSNWANIWKTTGAENVTIIYVPQLIQLLGYVFGALVILLSYNRKE